MIEARLKIVYKLKQCMMPKFAGYDCKECKTGEFTLNFRWVSSSVIWKQQARLLVEMLCASS